MSVVRFLDTNILLYAMIIAAAHAADVKEVWSEDLNNGQKYGKV